MVYTQLQELLKDRAEVREAAPSDAFDGAMPSRVVAPHDEETARALLAFCGEQNLAVAFRGGGTKSEIGASPRRLDVLISTEYLNEVFEHDEGNATVTAGAGIALEKLDEIVGERGQFVPCEYSQGATLGGIASGNFSGATRLRYGTPRDLIVGTHAALSDGRLLKAGGKVVKNVSGYDLGKLFVGSYGTLGMITQITLRLRPYDEASAFWTRRYDSFEEAATDAFAIFSGAFEPAILRARSHENGVILDARFDGGAASVKAQLSRLPQGGESRELSREERRGEYSQAPPREENAARVLAVLPLQSALGFLHNARENGAKNVIWDCGLGIVRADVTTQHVAALREGAEKCGGSLRVEAAPYEAKTPDFVWGAPASDFALQKRLKEKYDPRGICAPGRFLGGL